MMKQKKRDNEIGERGVLPWFGVTEGKGRGICRRSFGVHRVTQTYICSG